MIAKPFARVVRSPLLIIVFYTVFYLTSRLQNLTSLPVFGDEAIYIRWSQIIKNVETLRFVPLTDGKQPLFMWIVAVFLKFSSDPLLAGRLVSVFAGLATSLIIFQTICYLINFSDPETNPLINLISTLKKNYFRASPVLLIYLFSPFFFFFDRLALADNLLSFFGSLSLLLSLLLARCRRLDLALILGFSLGFGLLTKSPALYFVILTFVTYIIINRSASFKTFYYPLVSSLVAFAMYSILKLGPQFHQIALRNRDYVYTLSEIITHPLDPLVPHLKDIFTLYGHFFSIYLILFFLAIILLSVSRFRHRTILVLLIWWLVPLLANASFAKSFTARYILFTTPPLIILIGYLASYFNYKVVLPLLFLLLPNVFTLYRLSTSPFTYKLPPTETGYLQDWTSGWGIRDSASYLINRAKTHNVIVGTEGAFGTLPDGLQIYADGVKQLTIIGVGLGFTSLPPSLINAKNYGDDVYLLINQSRNNLSTAEQQKITPIFRHPKPDNDFLILYQL
ncbi:MAG: glycosyltransferase family 39 protein [Candidatus Shapirobacteria bacterium]|jgi:4-amino-4-deoxy-L-arabinose transferase-like glycosyltransferase